jgi:Ni2+-binding GTPase involved in maturation of urease and hydrogenase
MNQTNGLPQRLPFDHDKFVDRADEVKLVLEKAQRLAAASYLDKRTVIFHGARGSGKSWLLQEIAHQLQQNSTRALVVYIDLMSLSTLPVDEAVQQVLSQIDDGVTVGTGFSSLSTASDLASQANALVNNAQRLNKVLVLLIDHVYESTKDLLAKLEDHCLSPLAVEPNILIILAGRGREYIWKGPELRLKLEEHELSPFDSVLTLEQLRKQAPQAAKYAEEIYELSAGVPWSNYLLRALPASKTDALQHTKELLLGSETQVLARPYLEALSVLRAFDENCMPVMFAVYFEQPATNWTYADCREIRSQLIEMRLARWDRSKGEFTLDRAIQQIVEKALFENDSAMWVTLHCAAYRLYRDRASRYMRTSAQWQDEADYHAQCLQIKGYNVDNCTDRFEKRTRS